MIVINMFIVFVVVIGNHYSSAAFSCMNATFFNGMLVHVCIDVMCPCVCCMGVSTHARRMAFEILIPRF